MADAKNTEAKFSALYLTVDYYFWLLFQAWFIAKKIPAKFTLSGYFFACLLWQIYVIILAVKLFSILKPSV
jgi:hypothetical protein